MNATNGFTAWGVHLLTPTVPGTDARNTDGIDPGSSENITVTKSLIDNGDDNIAIKTGTHHMSVLDNHFYTGMACRWARRPTAATATFWWIR